jgi:hypothetical protein
MITRLQAAGTGRAGDDPGMVVPMYGTGGAEVGGPAGYTYGAVIVALTEAGAAGAGLTEVDPAEVGSGGGLAALREIRFSGWVARPVDGWQVAVAVSGDKVVAAGRRDVVGVGEALAARFAGTVLAVRVLVDRQLVLVAWSDGDEVGRYVSDPSREPGAADDVLSEPLGAEHAAAFAVACGRPEAEDDLAEVLAEELDPESVIESERLARVLRLLGLPTWLVAAPALPGDIPTGPSAREMTRLGAGVPGLLGRLCGLAVRLVRRRTPPPVIEDPPRGSSGFDPWLY